MATPQSPQPAINWNAAGAPIPPSLGRVADEYARVRALRLAMEHETETVAAREKELKDHLVNNLSKSKEAGGDTGAFGLRYKANIVTKTVYRAVDWKALHTWIAKNDRFDMLQKRLSDKVVAEYVEDQKTLLPGTEKVLVPDVSITKI